jgi:metal-dependent amidase/aminoacylase/carboxypeptidase family protein
MLRQFVPSTARMHGVITKGGAVANVVPDLTEASMRVRDATAEAARDLVRRVWDAAQGAAIATGCRVEMDETAPMYEERFNNMTMASRAAAYLARLGVDLEQPSRDNPAGSSDIGNVSRRLPIIHPYLQIADRDTAGHSEAMRSAAATPRAHEQVGLMATALAQTALDLLCDPDFFGVVRAEFASTVPARAADATQPSME